MARDRWPSQNKLTIAQVVRAIELVRTGWTRRDVAKLYGVSAEYIGSIVAGRRRQKAASHV